MKNQLAAIELRVLLGEFQHLVGARMEKVYDIRAASQASPGKALAFQLGKSEGKSFMVCLAPSAVFFSPAKPSAEVSPGGFCSFLRHHLGNARLLSISQSGSERILEFVFSSKVGTVPPRAERAIGYSPICTVRLIVELFSRGNVLLVDQAGIILGAAEYKQWADRTIRPGFAYSPPPPTPDFVSMPEDAFSKAVLSSEKDSVVKALAADLGLSGSYAEELCILAAVAKGKKPQQLSQQELGSLYSGLQQLLSMKPSPVAILDDTGNVSEVFPFPVAFAAAAKTKTLASFNEAVEALSTRLLDSSVFASQASSFARKIREVEIVIEQQTVMISGMEKAASESTAAAEAIYLNYADVRGILDDYNRLRKTFTPAQMNEYFKSNKKVVSIDEKTGTITIELGNSSE